MPPPPTGEDVDGFFGFFWGAWGYAGIMSINYYSTEFMKLRRLVSGSGPDDGPTVIMDIHCNSTRIETIIILYDGDSYTLHNYNNHC